MEENISRKDERPEEGSRLSSASKDIVVIGLVVVFILILSYFFNVFYLLIKFFEQHPKSIIFIDEIITGLLTLSIGLSLFAWRRWFELKKETTERIKLQETLLRNAETSATIERIISKQLRNDMDNLKQDVREIRQAVVRKTVKSF